MSNVPSIQTSSSVVGVGSVTPPTHGNTTANTASTSSSTAKPVPLFVNPSYRFDPSVGIEVIEFHDNTGAVASSIPTQRQLAAYRSHQATPPGEQPPPTRSTSLINLPGNAETSAG
jgi:hypothetical protein